MQQDGDQFDLVTNKAVRRVLAPFVRTVRRGQVLKSQIRPSLLYEAKHTKFLEEFSEFVEDGKNLQILLQKSCNVLVDCTKSTGVAIYIVDNTALILTQCPKFVDSKRHRVTWKIEENTTVASYVALRGEIIIVDELVTDPRFPLGVGWIDKSIRSVLCAPVILPNESVYAVIELFKDHQDHTNYCKLDLDLVVTMCGWMGTAIQENMRREVLQKDHDLNRYLLALIRNYYSTAVNIESILSDIVMFAKRTVGAERGSVFLVDEQQITSGYITAELFEESFNAAACGRFFRKKRKIRLSNERGVVSTVYRTKRMINIHDTGMDPRFCHEVDSITGFITRSILCMPILGNDEEVLGVIQLANKADGLYFSCTDEKMFSSFGVYLSLALFYYRCKENNFILDKKNQVFLDMLQFHMKPCKHDLVLIEKITEVSIPDDFKTFSWYVYGFESSLVQMVYYMLNEVMDDLNPSLNTLGVFILSAKKAYRNNPYHNFEHAFNVTHCMYNIIIRNQTVFTLIESVAMIVGALGHDVDHPGYNNSFLIATNHTMAQLYEESTLENHHVQVSLMLIENLKLFENVSIEKYTELKALICETILSTDLCHYFRCRSKIGSILADNTFDFTNNIHRMLMRSLCITCCDLSGAYKPFPIGKQITDNVYQEFYHQGDLEKQIGLCPLSMMDRDKAYLVEEDQVQFIAFVCLPCTRLMSSILPTTSEMYRLCNELKKAWEVVIEMRDKKVWYPSESVPQKDEK